MNFARAAAARNIKNVAELMNSFSLFMRSKAKGVCKKA